MATDISIGAFAGPTAAVLSAARYDFTVGAQPASPWHVREIDVTEELSGAFVAVIDLENDDPSADPEALLNDSALLVVSRPGGVLPRTRRFSGIIRRIEEVARYDRLARRFCRVFVEPAFACLKKEIRFAKYQEITVPNVLAEILRAIQSPYAREFDLVLTRLQEKEDSWRRYAVRDLCVQYGESSYDFARRIMAEEGISYYFDFSGTSERMIVVDDSVGFRDLTSGPVPFLPVAGQANTTETVSEFMLSREDAPGRAVLKTFDYTRHLELSATRMRELRPAEGAGPSALEVYEAHPNVTLYDPKDDEYTKSDMEAQAALRLEREIARSAVGSGRGNVIGFSPGHQFVLDCESIGGSHLAGKYLITSVRHRGRAPERRAAAQGSGELDYVNEFTCIPASVTFRPPAIRKPTAIEDYGIVVSASAGDPIWTDKHGRVRVRFLQLEGQESLPPALCSPWIPVSQLSAGNGFGVQLIPREGMLVRIRYREGDPDRPYVAGCLPTARQTLPSPPPGEKTRSTWRSRSMRSGGNDLRHYNEITLEDAANREELFIRAGRDLRRKVLNDDHTTIERDENRVVGRNQMIEVNGHREKRVHESETIILEQERSTTISGDDTRRVHGNDDQTVEGDQKITVRATRTTTVHKHEKATFLGGRDQTVTGDDRLHVTKKCTTTADEEWKAVQGPTELALKEGNATLKAGGDITLSVKGGRLKMDAGGNVTLEADEKIELACGQSSIVMTPDRIEIASSEVFLTGANGALELDGSGVTTTGVNVSSTALVKNELTGAIVKAN